jgi:hypothetical protein
MKGSSTIFEGAEIKILKNKIIQQFVAKMVKVLRYMQGS